MQDCDIQPTITLSEQFKGFLEEKLLPIINEEKSLALAKIPGLNFEATSKLINPVSDVLRWRIFRFLETKERIPLLHLRKQDKDLLIRSKLVSRKPLDQKL